MKKSSQKKPQKIISVPKNNPIYSRLKKIVKFNPKKIKYKRVKLKKKSRDEKRERLILSPALGT
jgi:hypothetical protein